MSRPQPPTPEVHRAQVGTWMGLVAIPVGIVALLFAYVDLNPVVHGLFGVLAALQVMIALRWWWKGGRPERR